jgi:hypothetical protein
VRLAVRTGRSFRSKNEKPDDDYREDLREFLDPIFAQVASVLGWDRPPTQIVQVETDQMLLVHLGSCRWDCSVRRSRDPPAEIQSFPPEETVTHR